MAPPPATPTRIGVEVAATTAAAPVAAAGTLDAAPLTAEPID